MTDAKVFPRSRRHRKLVPVLLSLLLAALLHLLAFDWGKLYFNHSASNTPVDSSISVSLLPLPLPQQAVSLPTAHAPKPVKPSKPARPARVAPVPAPTAPIAALDTPDSDTAIAASSDNTEVTAGAAGAAASAPATPTPVLDAPPEPAASQPGTQYHLDPPPSAALEYAVHAFSDKMDWYGSSKLSWKTDGSQYSIDGEVYARFIAKVTFLTYTSSGNIDEFGVAPQRYTEKKRNRPETSTMFDRDSKRIHFSDSANSYPRSGGEQDRASLIWQLAAIGRGDPEKFTAGNVIDLFVAGVRDGEVWRMQVLGQEDLSLPSGHVQAWHVVRQPRPGSYEQRLDIWLAPAQQWYPIRLRFSETNGDYLEMTLSDLKTL